MLAEMMVPLLCETLPTDIAHGVSAETHEFVATFGFDEAEVALGACAFYGVGGGAFEGEA
jgi:hypothetical protein